MTVEDLQYWILSRIETGELKEFTPIRMNDIHTSGSDPAFMENVLYSDLSIVDGYLVIMTR